MGLQTVTDDKYLCIKGLKRGTIWAGRRCMPLLVFSNSTFWRYINTEDLQGPESILLREGLGIIRFLKRFQVERSVYFV